MVVAAAGIVVLAGVTTVVTTAVATSGDVVALDDARLSGLTTAAGSCPALTPARLAGQVMATTGFEPMPESGIAGLSAAEWGVWQPWYGARPDDETASLLALAHLTCDLIGHLRVSGFVGDLWPLALAAFASSVSDVRAAGGVPEAAAAFVDRAQAYTAAYERVLGGWPGPSDQPRPSDHTGQTTPAPTTVVSTTPAPTTLVPTRPVPTQASPTTGSLRDQMAPGPQIPSLGLNYRDFHAASGLRLNGAATIVDGRLVLAESSLQAGSAWATQLVEVNRSFVSWFSVVIKGPADGLAFVVQAEGEGALGGTGSGIGYGSPLADDQERIRPSVAVELDTWPNGADGFDPTGIGRHIAVTTDGDITRHHVWADPGFDPQSNQPVYIWVSYSALSRTLTVHASLTSDKPAGVLLTYPVDLRAHLGTNRAWIGFTGGTGRVIPAEGRAEVLSWSAIQS